MAYRILILVIAIVLILFAAIVLIGDRYGMIRGTTDSEPPTITIENVNEATTDEPESNVFSLAEIQVGDTLGSLTVTGVESYNQKYTMGPNVSPMPMDENNFVITIQGDVELRGTYATILDGPGSGLHCFDVDKESQSMLIHLDIEPATGFCFFNGGKAEELFGQNKGTATITISEYELIAYPSEVWPFAILLSAEDIVVDEETYINSELGFSFVIPEGYMYKDLGKEPLFLGQLAEIRIGSQERIDDFVIDQTSTELWISVWDRVQDYELRTATKDGEECSSPFSQIGTVTISGKTVAKCYAKENDPVEQYNARYHYPLKADDGHVYLFVVDSLPDGDKADLDTNDLQMQTILESFFFL